jgi:hypothetical protein
MDLCAAFLARPFRDGEFLEFYLLLFFRGLVLERSNREKIWWGLELGCMIGGEASLGVDRR